MPRHDDTIAALSTASGTAAIAVVRISGPDTRGLARALGGKLPAPRVATHVDYRDRHGQLIDDVLLILFAAPRSYTGEDVLEIGCHGNPFIAQKILEDLFTRGCRPAEPGEFTQRAFLNRRLDLSQAEAVMDVINARSDRALAAAQAQLRGALGLRMEQLVAGLLGVLAKIEAYIDFPDEDLPPDDRSATATDIKRILLDCNRLTATSHYGAMLRDGVKTVIVGAPNVGKSNLLNALLGRERAIVSSEPGTTRDFLEDRLMVGPHCLRVIDTAGLNRSPAPLEQLGILKTLERVEEADLFLLVLDGSDPSVPDWPAILRERVSPANAIVVINKVDLELRTPLASLPPDLDVVKVSARNGEGLDRLRAVISQRVDALGVSDVDGIAISARHADALNRAEANLGMANAKLVASEPVELVASDLRAALDALGEITGRIDNERMLDALFASFCIGK